MRIRMTKAQRAEQIISMASELAASGHFSSWTEIEAHIRFAEDFSEARSVLDSPARREQLNAMCQHAKFKQSNG